MRRSIQEEILLTLWLIVGMISYQEGFWIVFPAAVIMSATAAFGMVFYAIKENGIGQETDK